MVMNNLKWKCIILQRPNILIWNNIPKKNTVRSYILKVYQMLSQQTKIVLPNLLLLFSFRIFFNIQEQNNSKLTYTVMFIIICITKVL